MSAESLIKFINHFRAKGDHDFASEVLGDAVSHETIHYWATDKGELHRVSDLAVWAAEARGLAGVEGDHAAAARRNLGWISASIANGMASVEYHERGVSVRAAAKCADLLRGFGSVRRCVALCDGRRIELASELPRDAIRALEAAVSFSQLPPPLPWRVERLPLVSVRHPAARRLAALAASESDLMGAVEAAGLKSAVSIFKIDGEEVITLQVGADSPLPQAMKDDAVGRNIWHLQDVRYASLMHSHLLDASRHGPTYHELQGSINGKPRHWRRPIFPCRHGLIITHTDPVAA